MSDSRMSTRWHGIEVEDGDWPACEPVAWWQVAGVFLLVSGVGPIILAQLAWWLVTGSRLGA